MKTSAPALMAAASFCAGVRHKRYSGQQEMAPENHPSASLRMTNGFAQDDNRLRSARQTAWLRTTIPILSCFKQNYHFF
ncbi:hypothetical protein [Flavobacterium cupreum]|nr:hypothetical protein [Flavobacterium cupreum]